MFVFFFSLLSLCRVQTGRTTVSAVSSIVLGLGMPTPSAYILAAVLVGPALTTIGFPLLEAHMFLLYYAILSALTPPIAVAALAAAAIADEDPFAIAFDAVRLAAIGFLMPFIFLWNPAVLGQGEWSAIALVAVGGVLAAGLIAVSVEWLVRGAPPLVSPVVRLAMVGAAVACVSPEPGVAVLGIACGVVLLGGTFVLGRARMIAEPQPVSRE